MIATGWAAISLFAHCVEVAGEPSVMQTSSLIGWPSSPPPYALTYLTAAWAAWRISGKDACGLDSMLIIPKVTGEPLAGLGVPSADDAEPPLPEPVVAVAPPDVLVAPPEVVLPEPDPELFEELPQAAAPSAATAQTPIRAPRLLSCVVITLPSLVAGPCGRR